MNSFNTFGKRTNEGELFNSNPKMEEERSTKHTSSSNVDMPPQNKIKIIRSREQKPDRANVPVEIGIKVRVFNRQVHIFSEPKIYFILSDTKVRDFERELREEFKIMKRDAFDERNNYRLYFESLGLDGEKRFNQMGFVTGDSFYFAPSKHVPKECTQILTAYLDFALHQSSLSKPSPVSHFRMENNEFSLSPAYSVLSRKSFFELGSIPNFVVENEFGRVAFLLPVDIRYPLLQPATSTSPKSSESSTNSSKCTRTTAPSRPATKA